MNESKNSTAKTVATTAMVFGAAGYVAGILSAPKSGRETRGQLATKGREYKAKASSAAERYKQRAGAKLEDAKQTVKNTVGRGKQEDEANPFDGTTSQVP